MTLPVDLRSDTVTRPTPAMRAAMAGAQVGDDRFGDDPTVGRLEEQAAEVVGKRAAVYLPTGTLCNQIAVHAFTRPGRLVLCESGAHVRAMEAGSAAALSGVAFLPVDGERGLLTGAQVSDALRPGGDDPPAVDLVAIENTHQMGGGTPWPVDAVREVGAACREAGLPLYLDGARLFNACAATGAAPADYAAHADALMFCLSKGLGAPIGSVLAGDPEFIAQARRLKVLFGAGWRQAGIMAAAGLVALREGPARLAEDHENARALAAGIAEALPGSVDPAGVRTNIVFADVSGTGQDPRWWAGRLAAEGVLVTLLGGRVRMLTHRDVDRAGIDTAIAAWRRVARAAPAGGGRPLD